MHGELGPALVEGSASGSMSPTMTVAASTTAEGPADGFVRLRLDLAYDGTDFHGWAQQKGGLRTVQGVLEETLAMTARAKVPLTVAGRTDAGVHARGQVAHVDVPKEMLEQRSVAGEPGKLDTGAVTGWQPTTQINVFKLAAV